ncbi:MAG: DoxX family protein [Rhodospirillales bacterium]|nr:DoxX family protein [Rhodospirillales bacterium]
MIDSNTAPYGVLLLRVSLGVMYITHGLLKVVVFTIPGTVQFFASLGLPAFVAYATMAGEVVGGVMLVVGIWPRAVALALMPVLLGATWVHSANGWVFSNPNGGWEYPFFLAIMGLVQVLLGDGAYALRPTPVAAARLLGRA